MNTIKQDVELYISFLKRTFNYSNKRLKEFKKQILKNPDLEYMVTSTTNDEGKFLVVEINFSLKKINYFIDTELVNDVIYESKEFSSYLRKLTLDNAYDDFKEFL